MPTPAPVTSARRPANVGGLWRLGDAAHQREVGLVHVRRLELEELAELVAHVDPLAGRNRHGDFSRDLRERFEVFGWYRLLDPTGTVRLELASDRDGLSRREAPVHLDEYLAVGPDAFACGLDKVDRAAELGVSH